MFRVDRLDMPANTDILYQNKVLRVVIESLDKANAFWQLVGATVVLPQGKPILKLEVSEANHFWKLEIWVT